MTRLVTLLSIVTLCVSCKSDKKVVPQETPKTLSIAENIVNANGFEHWKEVSKIDFTFNVDRDSSHFERSWTWKPKTEDVTLISGKDTISYNRKSIDSISMKADKAFINDKYWLLAPFQLVWDQGTTISKPIKDEAPITKLMMNKITLTYPSNGGYTPGDAYDFYFDDDYEIKEWVYRQGNSEKPSMITTWENYEDFKGLKIAKTHQKSEGSWKLYFTGITVETE
jgi:hypothetical protein